MKAGFNGTAVGHYEAFLFLFSVTTFFWSLGLKNACLSFFPSLQKEHRSSFFFNIALMLSGLAAITAFSVYGLGNWIPNQFGFESFSWTHYLAFFIFFHGPSLLSEIILLLQDRANEIMIYGAVIYSLQFLAVLLIVLSGGGLDHIFKFFLAWGFLRFIYLWILVLRFSKTKISWGENWKFLIFALPLMLNVLMGNGMEFVDGWIIGNHFNESDFAIFKYGAKELPFVTILIGALVSVSIPRLMQNGADESKVIKSECTKLMNWLYPVSIALMLLSPMIFPWVYSPDYTLSARIFNVYLLIIISRVILAQIYLLAGHRNYQLLVITTFELILNLGLSLWWVDLFGILGVAYATVVAYFVQKILLVVTAHRLESIKLKAYLDLPLYLKYNLALVIAFTLSFLY